MFLFFLKARYDYSAKKTDELTFVKGDIISNVYKQVFIFAHQPKKLQRLLCINKNLSHLKCSPWQLLRADFWVGVWGAKGYR